MNNKISKAVISRLPRYYRYLKELIDQGVERISSEELSRLMKATASQIRQDLNHFGGFGQQGYGYNVKSLYKEIGKILGVEREEMMSFGDSPNDIPMIKAAGIGVAVGNAKDSVKEAADYVTLSNDEAGVARAVEKFVFGE